MSFVDDDIAKIEIAIDKATDRIRYGKHFKFAQFPRHIAILCELFEESLRRARSCAFPFGKCCGRDHRREITTF